MKIIEYQNLKAYNTFGIKSIAKKFAQINTNEEAIKLFNTLNSNDKKLILGGGSNLLLIKDFDGLVIKNNIKGIQTQFESDIFICLKVGAGENWHDFVMYCVRNNYAGIENLSLIPGNVGASPMQNIGAYGVEVKDVIETVEAIEVATQKLRTFSNKECKFDYRSSIFKTTLKDQYLITAVTFKLSKNPNFKISYGAIQSQLSENGVDEKNINIQAISNAVIQIRQSKLPDPKKIGNSGSFFKNPIITKEKGELLLNQYPKIPLYRLENNLIKVAAGWLIEQAGWKGYKENSFGVHEKQALVLVNYGDATGQEIFDLSEKILQSVKKKFGIELEREVNII